MAHQILTSLLFLAGIILALGVAVVYLFDLFQSKKPLYLLPVAVAFLFGWSQVSNLIYESSILACAIVPDRTLLLSGLTAVLHLLLLIYGFHVYHKIQERRVPNAAAEADRGQSSDVQ